MKTFLFGLAAAVIGLAASAQTASAQVNRNIINNSGNGVGNRIVVGNNPNGSDPFGGSGFNKNVISNSGNGVGNRIVVGNGGGQPFFPGLPGCNGPSFPGSIGGSFPGGGVFPGGVNINVVTNSGNGSGNVIRAGNGQPGGLNINVVANSGNGIGNRIILGNR